MRSINSQFCWHCVLPGQRSYLSSAGLGKEFADTKTKELTWYGNNVFAFSKPAQKRIWLAGCGLKAFVCHRATLGNCSMMLN